MDPRRHDNTAAYMPSYVKPYSYLSVTPYNTTAVGYGEPTGYPMPYPAPNQPAAHPPPPALISTTSLPTPSPSESPEEPQHGQRQLATPTERISPPLPSLFRPIQFDSVVNVRKTLPPTPDSLSEQDRSEASSAASSPRSQALLVTIPRLTSSKLTKGDITLNLLDAEMWKSFNAVGNEMIVTKPGRRLFPSLLISLQGLDPSSSYNISLKIISADQYRYKFLSQHWVPVGESEVIQNEERQLYTHPNSPHPGSFWMKKPISFKAVKITHNHNSKNGNILLHTMHKYVMEIIIQPVNAAEITIPIPETTFVAVTAYQNTKLTQLKIDNNPFAKGFRDREAAGSYLPTMPLSAFPLPPPSSSALWQQMACPIPPLPPMSLKNASRPSSPADVESDNLLKTTGQRSNSSNKMPPSCYPPPLPYSYLPPWPTSVPVNIMGRQSPEYHSYSSENTDTDD